MTQEERMELLRAMNTVDVASIYGFLDWRGEDWPQPKLSPALDWDRISELWSMHLSAPGTQ